MDNDGDIPQMITLHQLTGIITLSLSHTLDVRNQMYQVADGHECRISSDIV